MKSQDPNDLANEYFVPGDPLGTRFLSFPNLQVLEIGFLQTFPFWILVPPTIKFFTHHPIPAIPEILELLISTMTGFVPSAWAHLTQCAPRLRVLRYDSGARGSIYLRQLLRTREEKGRSGTKVRGVPPERLEKLSFREINSWGGYLHQFRESVNEVVGWESESKTWEIEL